MAGSIKDDMIWHQIHTDRFKQNVQNQMLRNLELSRKHVLAQLAELRSKIKSKNSNAIWTKARLERQLQELNNSLQVQYDKMNKTFSEANVELVTEEIDWNKSLLEGSVGANLNIAAPSTAQVFATVRKQPFEGWAGKQGGAARYSHNSPLRNVPKTHINSMERIVRDMYLTGGSNSEAEKRIAAVDRAIGRTDKSYDLARRNVSAEVRTGIQTYAQHAREEVHAANNDLFPWSEFSATLDGRTTTICASLDGRTYRQDDEGKPAIPQHWNCRSTYVPKRTKEEELPGLRPAVAPGASYEAGDDTTRTGRVRKPRKGQEGILKRIQVNNATKFQDWLATQDQKNPAFVRDYFKTDARYDAWKQGKVKNIRYTSEDGRTYGIKSLRNAKAKVAETNEAR